MKIRYHSFILVEVLIAIALISMLILPISSFPYKTHKKEIEKLQALELALLSQTLYADFIENVDTLLPDDLITKREASLPLGTHIINLEPAGKYPYTATLSLSITNSCEVKPNTQYHLAKCTLILTPERASDYKPDKITHLITLKTNCKK